MDITDLKFWLALWRMPTIGVRHFYEIWKQFPKLEEFFSTSSGWRLQNGFPEQLQIDERGVAQDLEWLQQSSEHIIITRAEQDYPSFLQEIASAPPLLFVKGDPKLLATIQVAIVGSRNPTPAGIETAKSFAETLSHLGFVITSGLALGVDTASHEGALQDGGKTIAVLGTSIEQVYPKKNKGLALEITAKGGALVSEFPIGTPALAEHFPRRNRIISGLSRGVLVVEATLRSGSLITARFANEQGREVFAIPGSIHNPLAQGCHVLIQQGAKLVEKYQDIVEEIAPSLIEKGALPPAYKTTAKLANNQQELLNCVNFEPTTVDVIVERSQLGISEITSLLSTLELQGYVLATTRGYVRVKL